MPSSIEYIKAGKTACAQRKPAIAVATHTRAPIPNSCAIKFMRERGAYVFSRTFPTRFDKAVRAQSIRGRMALDGLIVPMKAAWYPAFRAELLSFPAGKHDDQVDAMGLI